MMFFEPEDEEEAANFLDNQVLRNYMGFIVENIGQALKGRHRYDIDLNALTPVHEKIKEEVGAEFYLCQSGDGWEAGFKKFSSFTDADPVKAAFRATVEMVKIVA